MGKLLSVAAVGAALAVSGQPQSESTSAAQFHLSNIGYVMLGTTDLKAAIEFYRDRLGLKVVRQSDDIVFLDTGSVSVVISTGAGRDPGSTEIVFSVDHVQTAFEALSHDGLTFERKPHQVSGTSWAANFRDPDRHILSLFGPK